MPSYGFDCATCGPFTLMRAMAASGEPAFCPRCHEPGRRVFRSPGLAALDPALRNAFDASARSVDAPTVVTSVPGTSRRATPITRDPRHTRLPRP